MEKRIGNFVLSYKGKNGYCEYQSYNHKAASTKEGRFIVLAVTPKYRRHLYVVGIMTKEELSNFM